MNPTAPTQISFAQAEYDKKKKRTRREVLLEKMEQVVPWSRLMEVIEPYYPKSGKRGRPPIGLERMLRMYFVQQWYGLADEAVEDAVYDSVALRNFMGIDLSRTSVPDATTLMGFRHLLEAHDLPKAILVEVNVMLMERGLLMTQGTLVDATLIAAPSSTKNKEHARDPEMHQAKKGNQWHFGMKAHIGADAESGLVHTVTGTAANEHDITQAHALLHGEEAVVFADSGYRGITKRQEIQAQHPGVDWQVAMMPGKRRALKKSKTVDALIDKLEKIKASIRAKVEHPFRVIKCQFGYRKTRYRGLVKNTAQLTTLFALSNLWMVRKRIIQGPAG